MSVLENSFTSQRDSPTRVQSHSLCQDLVQLGAKPDIQQLSSSKPQIQSQQNDSSFLSPNQNNKLQHEPSIDLQIYPSQSFIPKQFSQQDQPAQVQGEPVMQDDNSSPKTITLIQQNIESKQLSINMSSKISHYSMEVDNQSYATFLSIRDTSYNSLIKNFQLLFQNVSNIFTERIKKISQTYLTFIKIKYNQQKSYLSTSLSHPQNTRNQLLYINFKTISEQIRKKIQSQTQQRTQYIKSLQQISTKLQKHFQTTIVSMQSKKQKIKEIHTKLNATIKQMNDLMIPQIRKKQKSLIDKQIYSSCFLRTKYLMSKQKLYLSLIASYLQKVLNFVSYVCLDVEPNTCLIVKQSMLGYIQALSTFSPASKEALQKQILALQKTHCFNQTYQQVAKILQICIPDSICPYNINQSKDSSQKKLKKLIQSLISQSQSLVYIPVIQLQPKDYAYHSKNKANIKWLKINQNKKQLSHQSIQQYQTYVIITHDGQLILQLIDQFKKSEQKMAILKLKSIKFSRKNNHIYLTDRASGMLGYLLSSNALIGTLCFQGLGKSGSGSGGSIDNQNLLVDQFIERVKDVLEIQKQNRDKNKSKIK